MTNNAKYWIVKYYDDPNKVGRVQKKMGKLSRADAMRICKREDSSTHSQKPPGKNWFYGFKRA